MKKWRMIVILFAAAVGVGMGSARAHAKTIYDSPYVTFSPDGRAWTTNAGVQDMEWYAADGSEDVITGIPSALGSLNRGEHYYSVWREGEVPIGAWKVAISRVNCCHNSYPEEAEYHGVSFAREVCLKPHFSGWKAYCADCGEALDERHFYMSRQAAESIDHLDVGTGYSYYYLCPFNRNLEQGFSMQKHRCKEISANRYRVEYIANTDDVCGGYMQPSFHVYDNNVIYEGRTVVPQKRLNRNRYSRIGWEFAGWNTKPDGTGTAYEDMAEILNLCEGDYGQDADAGNVKLYAVWHPSACTLEIDPAGGTYLGSKGITSLTREYQSSYTVSGNALKTPAGYTVSFDTGGGAYLAPITGSTHLADWEQKDPFLGEWKDGSYFFTAPDKHTDRITARYESDAIRLPRPVKANASFGGWYYDAQFSDPAGEAGEELVPTRDLTLHAQWVELVLNAEDNYRAHGGVGAVDLSWAQNDGQNKTYKIYQQSAGESWKQIYTEQDQGNSIFVAKQFGYSGQTESYTVPHTGFYQLAAYGAQGGSYGGFSGGAGGSASGSFWLKKGELLTICVGGQNGYNGGGSASLYGNGGGCTTVYSDRQGLLLTAGGGGGAAPNGNGGAGGQTQSLAGGASGESGASGGGGGFIGGKSGELIVHNHVWGVCNHVHSGDPSRYGECYTVEVICGRPLEAVHTGTQHWYWGGSNTDYCPNCGAIRAKGEDCIGHTTDYYNHVCPVHGNRQNNTSSNSPQSCDAIDGYAPGCGQTEDYICGYPYDGYVVSSKSAYGGSSYVSTAARNYVQTPGVRQGNGSFLLTSEDIGYQDSFRMDGVLAADREPPEEIRPESVTKTPAGEGSILVKWEAPRDRGTDYYHRADSFSAGSTRKLCSSNITKNTLTSGIKGYYYCLDSNAATQVSKTAGNFLAAAQLKVDLADTERYLHVRAVDVAGNLGNTAHILIGSRIKGEADTAWPIFTEQLKLEESDNVYAVPGEKLYYVKSDGRTPFVMDFRAYIKGTATAAYQPNRAVLESAGKGGASVRSSIYVPGQDVADREIAVPADQIEIAADGEAYIRNAGYYAAMRSNRNKDLEIVQELVLDREAEGREIKITPTAEIDWKKSVIRSDHASDLKNSIRIIGDGTAPVIHGLENWEELTLLDRRNGDVRLRVFAEDALSGIRTLRMEIRNLDNDAEKQYFADASGVIDVDITEDIPVFSGDLTVTVYACDNVGNESKVVYGTTEFDLRVEIERELEPHTPVFKQGESGRLIITTWGYAERVEVEFPEELTGLDGSLDQVYVYEWKQNYRQQENCTFMIPLGAPEAEQYRVTVRAYKGDKMLERYPALEVMKVEGTVLDEIHTRLR